MHRTLFPILATFQRKISIRRPGDYSLAKTRESRNGGCGRPETRGGRARSRGDSLKQSPPPLHRTVVRLSPSAGVGCGGATPERTVSGTLYLVGVPIGNPEDLGRRAVRILESVAVIAAEDPLVTRSLLDRYGIPTPLTSYQDRNKEEKAPILIARLLEGRDVALV